MNTFPYTSIKSVLYDLSRVIPEPMWNETDMLEWAYKAVRRIRVPHKYSPHVSFISLEEHKAELPRDLRYLTEIMYFSLDTTTALDGFKNMMNLYDIQWNPAMSHMTNPEALPKKALEATLDNRQFWKPMRATTNVFLQAITCNPSMFPSVASDLYNLRCDHEFVVDANGTLTSTLQNGILAVSYLRYPTDEDNVLLIPDSETLKEAIMNYCLWMYFLKKDIVGDTNADKKAANYKIMFGHMAAKASAELNEPDINTLENIKNNQNRLVPREHQFDSGFAGLSHKENIKY